MTATDYPTFNMPIPVCPTCNGDGVVSYSGSELYPCEDCKHRPICGCGSDLPVTETGVCIVCVFCPVLPAEVAS